MDFIDDFIKEYKSNPCLWKADSTDFKNRSKRQEAYTKLIDVATRHGEHYNVERTKQKINNLRCAFRHQFKKYNELKKKGEKYEPYCPKRRYFESLMFLKDEEIPDKRSKREIKECNESSENAVVCSQIDTCNDFSDPDGPIKCNEGDKVSSSSAQFCGNIFEEPINNESVTDTLKRSNISIKEMEVLMPGECIDSSEIKPVHIASNVIEITNLGKEQLETQILGFEKDNTIQKQSKSYSRKRSSSISSQISNETEQIAVRSVRADISSIEFEKLLSLAFKNVASSNDDHYSNFGKIIAHKLRCMDPTQAIYAEKIIADVLYQGQMKMLSTISIQKIQNFGNSQVYGENHNK